MSRKAYTLEEIDQAVQYNEALNPDHEFFTDFSTMRGEFEERLLYKYLNLKWQEGKCVFSAKDNTKNKVLLFLGGMRGTGKTTELARYAKKFNAPDAFLCVTCNLDEGLNKANMEYMDILIFQLEQLTAVLNEKNVPVNQGIIQKMERWFEERTSEVNRALKAELGLEVGNKAERQSPFSTILKWFGFGGAGVATGLLSTLLGVFGSFKAGVTGSYERTEKVRSILKNRFGDFADIFNEYIEEVNIAIRARGIGQEVLFIIDGLEKTLSVNVRKKIVIEESGFMQKIKAYTIFTLPIELMKERPLLSNFSIVTTFPFIKLFEQDGERIGVAFERFTEFVYKRIDAALFDDNKTVQRAIECSGGSPRELLRILETAAFYADETKGVIDNNALQKALARLGDDAAQYLTSEELDVLVRLEENNLKERPHFFDEKIERLLERNIVMEYNAGTHKRPNPVIKYSKLYQAYKDTLKNK